MKTQEEIIDETKVDEKLGVKLAFYCTECPWWTNDLASAKVEGHYCNCPKCDTRLRFFAIEDFFNLFKVNELLEGFSENQVQEGD